MTKEQIAKSEAMDTLERILEKGIKTGASEESIKSLMKKIDRLEADLS
jgi:hypothetical protein